VIKDQAAGTIDEFQHDFSTAKLGDLSFQGPAHRTSKQEASGTPNHGAQ
jgi:hypothetical protein